ncbi:MAG: hypothetical protein KY468_02525 [Armatimonadetes bacterium]|nr:hypothetical protein [Armatimonadota bacterium]
MGGTDRKAVEWYTANGSGFWGNNYGHVVDGHVLRDGEGLYLWAWNTDAPSPVAFCDLIGSRTVGRGNITLRGPLVFGNTVRFSEVVDFRYRPSLHIQPTWLQGEEPEGRFGINLEPATHKIPGLPPTAPLKDWNVIEGTHIYDGPAGIRIAKDAGHTFLRRNTVHVEGPPLRNDSTSTVIQ